MVSLGCCDSEDYLCFHNEFETNQNDQLSSKCLHVSLISDFSIWPAKELPTCC